MGGRTPYAKASAEAIRKKTYHPTGVKEIWLVYKKDFVVPSWMIPTYKVFEENAEPYIKNKCVTIIVDIISKKPREEREQTTVRLNSTQLRRLADYLDSLEED